MNARTYINNAHKALSRNPGGLTLEELSGKLRAKALKVGQQIRELHDAGLIETTEDAGQPVYKLKAAPAAKSGRADIPPPQYDPASVAFPSCVVTHNQHTGTPRNPLDIESDPAGLLIVKDGELLKAFMAGDSEGGETDAPAVDAQREEFTLLGLIADIRAAAGDPDGRLMQDELVQHIAAIVKERDDLRERLDAQIKQWQADTSSLLADRWAAMEARSKAINEADRLRAELGAERLALTALQEQVDNPPAPVAQGYAVKAPKRPLRRFGKEAAAKSAAMAAARLAGRGEVFALVPLGVAVRGAEWKEA